MLVTQTRGRRLKACKVLGKRQAKHRERSLRQWWHSVPVARPGKATRSTLAAARKISRLEINRRSGISTGERAPSPAWRHGARAAIWNLELGLGIPVSRSLYREKKPRAAFEAVGGGRRLVIPDLGRAASCSVTRGGGKERSNGGASVADGGRRRRGILTYRNTELSMSLRLPSKTLLGDISHSSEEFFR